jgi:hypothetical protein
VGAFLKAETAPVVAAGPAPEPLPSAPIAKAAPAEVVGEGPAEAPGEARSGLEALLEVAPEADEATLSRILSQTDAHLAEPEASRRREAVAALKAAVAATEAARRLGESIPNPRAEARERTGAFRADLRQAVQPRRPAPLATGAAPRLERPRPMPPRPTSPRPAPLKLVASQRVDLPVEAGATRGQLAQMGPVRPRRVTPARDDAPHPSDRAKPAAAPEPVPAPVLEALPAAAPKPKLAPVLEAVWRPSQRPPRRSSSDPPRQPPRRRPVPRRPVPCGLRGRDERPHAAGRP